MDNTINEIRKLFGTLSHEKKKVLLLETLGKPAVDWYDYRQKTKGQRIVDPKTGRWVSEFSANGQKYFIRTPDEGLSLLRYSKLKEYLSIVGFDATYSEQMAAYNRMVGYANTLVTPKPQLNALFAEIENQRKAIQNANRNWDFSAIAATLFVVRPDEKLDEWVQVEQEKKIEDWNKANIPASDFFLLCIGWGSQLQQQYSELLTQAQKMGQQSASLVGST